MGGWRGNVKPLKYPLDGGKILRIFLSLLPQLRIVWVQKQSPDLAAQGKGGHISLCRKYILVNNSGSGFHGFGHQIGNIIFDHRGGVGSYHQPEQSHPYQGNDGCNYSDSRSKLFVLHESHKHAPPLGNFAGPAPRYNIAHLSPNIKSFLRRRVTKICKWNGQTCRAGCPVFC